MVRLRSPHVGNGVKAAALRFLKIRPRSIAEMKEKLKVKGFSSAEIESTVVDLMASGLLDDRAFTKNWINYRLARPFGFRRIIQELKDKGIGQEMIRQAMAGLKGHYDPENVALELAQRRWERLPAVDPEKNRRKVLDFLLRRGFEEDIVMKVLKRL